MADSIRQPPHSLEAEQSVLGGVLLDHAGAWPVALDPGDFYRPAHRLIFENMRSLAERGQPIDVVTLLEDLRERGVVEKVGGAVYLAELAESTPAASNVAAYATIVRDHALRRRRISDAAALAEAAYGGDSESILEAEARIRRGYGGAGAARAVLYADLPEAEPIPWVVDKLIYRGGLHVFTGAPKAGKSTGIRSLAALIASGGGIWLGREVQAGRALYLDCENPRHVAQFEMDAIASSGLSLADLAVLLGEPAPVTLADALALVDAELAAHRPALCVLDGLASFTRVDDLNDYAKVYPALAAYRALAARHDVAIVFQHHASKGDPSGLLGSTAIAGQVDLVVAFGREVDPDGKSIFHVQTQAERAALPIARREVTVVHGRTAFVEDEDRGGPQW